MLIAVDVMGTLKGPKQAQILKIIHAFQNEGHEVIVWSNDYGYAVDIVKQLGLECEAHQKWTKGDVAMRGDRMVDLAIDDDSTQTWLGAKNFLWVHQIPLDMPVVTAREALNKENKGVSNG